MKYRIAVSILLFSMLLAVPVFAHPPKGIDLVFEPNTKVLRVNIPHAVDDPSKHYIEKVVVELNEEEIITQAFKMQKDKKVKNQFEIINTLLNFDTIVCPQEWVTWLKKRLMVLYDDR